MKTMQLRLPSKSSRELIIKYLHILKSYFHLTDKEVEILSAIMNKAITGNGDLTDVLSYEGRQELCKELNLKKGTFDVALNRLKKKNVLFKMGGTYRLTKILRGFKFDAEGCILQFELVLENAK